jgi:hypothetical protein
MHWTGLVSHHPPLLPFQPSRSVINLHQHLAHYHSVSSYQTLPYSSFIDLGYNFRIDTYI